jgi:hypothetical protein
MSQAEGEKRAKRREKKENERDDVATSAERRPQGPFEDFAAQ